MSELSAKPNKALACPEDKTPAATRFCTPGGNFNRRIVFVTCGLDLPNLAASSSWVPPKSSSNC